MYPLREINIDLDKICRIYSQSEAIMGAGDSPIFAEGKLAGKCLEGWGYAIEYDTAILNARNNGMNLDSYLTAQIAVFMQSLGDRKSPLAVWHCNARIYNKGIILLHITSLKECRFMQIENSYDSHSLGNLPASSALFMYYDGKCAFRTHLMHGIEDKHNLLCDLGGFDPYIVGVADQFRYDEILKSPLDKDNIIYSPVPTEKESICQWNGKKAVVEHVFCVINI